LINLIDFGVDENEINEEDSKEEEVKIGHTNSLFYLNQTNQSINHKDVINIVLPSSSSPPPNR